jgi:fumarylpyruvate hydrolase
MGNSKILRFAGSSRELAVNRVYNIGRNYAAQRNDPLLNPDGKLPLIYMKPADTIDFDSGFLRYPKHTQMLCPEVELVVIIGKSGEDINASDAADMIMGFGVGLDWARKELLIHAMKNGEPWDSSKVFPGSSTLSEIVPMSSSGLAPKARVSLKINGNPCVAGLISDMVWNVNEIVSQLSRIWKLEAGDVIYTGTPAPAPPVSPGDSVRAEIDGIGALEVQIIAGF